MFPPIHTLETEKLKTGLGVGIYSDITAGLDDPQQPSIQPLQTWFFSNILCEYALPSDFVNPFCLVALGEGLRFSISHKFPVDVDIPGTCATLCKAKSTQTPDQNTKYYQPEFKDEGFFFKTKYENKLDVKDARVQNKIYFETYILYEIK